jgi:hypothetical protein
MRRTPRIDVETVLLQTRQIILSTHGDDFGAVSRP